MKPTLYPKNNDCVIVKLKQAKNNLRGLYGVPEDVEAYQENDIMMGVAFLRRQASRLRKNISILIGVGSNSGSHTGSSALEALLSNVGIMTGIAVSVPAGNEGIAGIISEVGSKGEALIRKWRLMLREITALHLKSGERFPIHILWHLRFRVGSL